MSDQQISVFENFFVESVEYCIKAMTSFQSSTSPTTKESLNGDIIATVGLSSTLCRGSVSLVFPKKTFLKISNALLLENETEITHSNQDAASEILNIVYGYARTGLNKIGHDFLPAIPTVINGNNLSVNNKKNGSEFYDQVSVGNDSFYLTGSFDFNNK